MGWRHSLVWYVTFLTERRLALSPSYNVPKKLLPKSIPVPAVSGCSSVLGRLSSQGTRRRQKVILCLSTVIAKMSVVRIAGGRLIVTGVMITLLQNSWVPLLPWKRGLRVVIKTLADSCPFPLSDPLPATKSCSRGSQTLAETVQTQRCSRRTQRLH